MNLKDKKLINPWGDTNIINVRCKMFICIKQHLRFNLLKS